MSSTPPVPPTSPGALRVQVVTDVPSPIGVHWKVQLVGRLPLSDTSAAFALSTLLSSPSRTGAAVFELLDRLGALPPAPEHRARWFALLDAAVPFLATDGSSAAAAPTMAAVPVSMMALPVVGVLPVAGGVPMLASVPVLTSMPLAGVASALPSWPAALAPAKEDGSPTRAAGTHGIPNLGIVADYAKVTPTWLFEYHTEFWLAAADATRADQIVRGTTNDRTQELASLLEAKSNVLISGQMLRAVLGAILN